MPLHLVQRQIFFLMYAVTLGNFTNFHAIAVSLQYRTPFRECYCFINRFCFHDNVAADCFFDLAKWTIGYNPLVLYHAAFIEWKTVAAYKFVLRCNTTNP